MTFWERYHELCIQEGKSANAVALELGFSNATCTKWKNGSEPGSKSISKIADYFGVTVDYLLGTEPKPSAPVTDEDLKFALFNGADGITDEMFEEVKWFARAVMEREQAKKANIEKTEYPVRAAARNGTPPSTGTITKAEADEVRKRPDADSDL